jgi:hypothetical protein
MVVQEDAVVLCPRPLLERQRDQAAEAAVRQRVLVRTQAIVGSESDGGPRLHRLGDEMRFQPSGQCRRNRLVDEEPDVRTAAGSQPFGRRRQVALPARVEERRDRPDTATASNASRTMTRLIVN